MKRKSIFKRSRFLAVLLFSAFVGLLMNGVGEVQAGVPENEILLVSHYTNYAWGYQDKGSFMDTEGKIYGFDFSEESYTGDAEKLVEKLKAVRESSEPVAVIKFKYVKKIYRYGMKINPDAKKKKKQVAFDAGTTKLSFYNPEKKEFFLCEQWGDYEIKVKDDSVKKLLKVLKKSEKSADT